MSSFLPRLYILAAAMAFFFLSWAAVAARPWQDTAPRKQDPRLALLYKREKELKPLAQRPHPFEYELYYGV